MTRYWIENGRRSPRFLTYVHNATLRARHGAEQIKSLNFDLGAEISQVDVADDPGRPLELAARDSSSGEALYNFSSEPRRDHRVTGGPSAIGCNGT